MSARRLYYIDSEYNDEDDDSEFLRDVPYSPSSVDSIPWADDAIKKNQMDWEHVERMLSGEEDLPQEPELRNEIQEWQLKFPQLLGVGKAKTRLKRDSVDSLRTNLNDSLDVETISNLSIDSLEEEDSKSDEFLTPTVGGRISIPSNVNRQQQRQFSAQKRSTPHCKDELSELLNGNLHINSVSFSVRNPRLVPTSASNVNPKHITHPLDSSASSMSTPVARTPTQRKDSNNLTFDSTISNDTKSNKSNLAVYNRIRMPPILNVLESKRRFRGLTNNNRSFVQLTQVQQAKSAAVTHQPKPQTHTRNQSAWHNRNSIILPAIHLQRIHEHATTTSTSEGVGLHSLSNSSFESGGISGRPQYHFVPQRFHGATTTTTTTPSSGRSISAAVQHPRPNFNAFYLPYNAFKFKAFNK